MSDKPKIDTTNEFVVCIGRDGDVELLRPVPLNLTKPQARRLAAWLALIAEDEGDGEPTFEEFANAIAEASINTPEDRK